MDVKRVFGITERSRIQRFRPAIMLPHAPVATSVMEGAASRAVCMSSVLHHRQLGGTTAL